MAMIDAAAAIGDLTACNLTLNGLRDTDGVPFPLDVPLVLAWTPCLASGAKPGRNPMLADAFEVELLGLDATRRWSSGRTASNATDLLLSPDVGVDAASTHFLRVRL